MSGIPRGPLTTARMETMEAAKGRISFLTLSPELRNRIYELACCPLRDGEGGEAHSTAIRIEPRESYELSAPFATQPALTKVSRQIRQETLPIYYGTNEFNLYLDETYRPAKGPDGLPTRGASYVRYIKFSTVDRWVKAMGDANAKPIKHISVFSPSFRGDLGIEGILERGGVDMDEIELTRG